MKRILNVQCLTLIVVLVLPCLVISCAKTAESKAKPGTPALTAATDEAADEALGALDDKRKSAGERLKELEAESASRDALREAERRAREEEQRRLQDSINEERIVANR